MERNGKNLFNWRRKVSYIKCLSLTLSLSPSHDDTLLVLSSRLHINYTSALRVLMDSFSDSRIPDSHASDLRTTLSVLASVPSCFHGNSALVSLIETVWGIPHRTLFSCRHKMETIGILRRIINHLTTAVKQVRKRRREEKKDKGKDGSHQYSFR